MDTQDRLINIEEVMRLVMLDGRTIYAMAKAKKFPQPITVTHKNRLWHNKEIDSFIKDQLSTKK